MQSLIFSFFCWCRNEWMNVCDLLQNCLPFSLNKYGQFYIILFYICSSCWTHSNSLSHWRFVFGPWQLKPFFFSVCCWREFSKIAHLKVGWLTLNCVASRKDVRGRKIWWMYDTTNTERRRKKTGFDVVTFWHTHSHNYTFSSLKPVPAHTERGQTGATDSQARLAASDLFFRHSPKSLNPIFRRKFLRCAASSFLLIFFIIFLSSSWTVFCTTVKTHFSLRASIARLRFIVRFLWPKVAKFKSPYRVRTKI